MSASSEFSRATVEAALWITAAFAFVIGGLVASAVWSCVNVDQRAEWERQAVRRGYGEWGQGDQPVFRWKEAGR